MCAIAFMDTDSAAIAATKDGGLIPCRGGDHQTSDGVAAIKALTWRDVEEIRNKFAKLNPYNPDVLPGSILKLEDENFATAAEGTKVRRQIECFAIASKRYVLFERDEKGIRVIKASEHGLGNHVAPIDPETGKPIEDWIEQAWLWILHEELEVLKPIIAPSWFKQIVRTRLRITTPFMLEWFRLLDVGKGSQARVRPFNSFDHAILSKFRMLSGALLRPIRLVSPTSSDPPERMDWVNIHAPDEGPYRLLHAERRHFDKYSRPGLTYAELIERHRFHAESKSLGPDGDPCKQLTRGVLSQRAVEVIDVVHIGKEANELELVQAGLILDQDEVQLRYEKDEWHYLSQVVSEIPIGDLMDATGYSRSMAYALKASSRKPSTDRMGILRRVAAAYARERLVASGIDPRGLDEIGWVRALLEYERKALYNAGRVGKLLMP